jgi:4-hydroxy-3-methylbut-2-enyl diphosphate reductase
MRVCVARLAGFCWGVRRAVDIALEASARFGHQEAVRTLGPLIHNPQALDHLARRGITMVGTAQDLSEGSVIIRAHGVPLEELRALAERRRQGRIRVFNGTCPAVARVQALIRRQSARGGFTIILGHPGHAEVCAHHSFAQAGCAVIQTQDEAEALPPACLQGALVVAQTTFSTTEFQAITSRLKARHPNLRIQNTVCPDTCQRQAEARSLAEWVDAVVVVGGRASNNTRHLVEVVQEMGKPVQWVEQASDLDLPPLRGLNTVGLLAGASTPTWTVDEVVETLEQAGQPSRLRRAWRISRTLQLPVALGAGLLTLLLHWQLEWHTGWSGPALPVLFQLALCAILPYLDPLGIDAQGWLHGQFLAKQRSVFIAFGGACALAALLAAITLGAGVLAGTVVLGFLPFLYQRLPISQRLAQVPALKDLGQAIAPMLLAVVLPWTQGRPTTPVQLALACIVLFSVSLAAHSLRHIWVFRKDQIIGREVLSVAIGSHATGWVAAILLFIGVGALVLLLAAPHLG